MGDYYNLNLLNHQNHNASVELLDGFYSYVSTVDFGTTQDNLTHSNLYQ